MKLYLDTNIIYNHFVKVVRKEKVPKVYEFLYSNKDAHNYYVSNLTRAEIFRILHSEFNVTSEECYRLWEDFLEALCVKEIIIEEFERKIKFNEIADMLSRSSAGRGIIINLIHLLIAKEGNLIVLTGDKALKGRFKVFYREILTYYEVRKLI